MKGVKGVRTLMAARKNQTNDNQPDTRDEHNAQSADAPAYTKPMRQDAPDPQVNIPHRRHSGLPDVKAQPQNPNEVEDPKQARIEYLKAKSDRTLEEGLELQELEIGVEKSKLINAGWTSERVHEEQEKLRQREEDVNKEREALRAKGLIQ